jgi:hypothetical protein
VREPASLPVPAGPPTPSADAGAASGGAVARLVVLVLGTLALGLSPFLDGGYSPSVWAACGLVLVVLILVLVLALPAPPRLEAPAVLAVGALVALGLWSRLSAGWSPSESLAGEAGLRLLALGGLLLVLTLLVRDARTATWALGAATAGVVAVALWTLARLLTGEGRTIFLGGRLDAPLGYVNGQGSIYVLAMLACLSLAGWRRSPALAGAAAGAATLLAGLAFLCQSRGVAVTAITGALVVVLCVGGRLRRAWAAAVIAVGTAVMAPTLNHVLEQTTYRGTPPSAIDDAGVMLLLATVGVGVVWGALVAYAAQPHGPAARRLRGRATAGLTVLGCAGLLVTAVHAPGIVDRVSDQYHAFVGLDVQPDANGSRLLSGGGTRYDYWRVALNVFTDHPLAGAGAGGYVEPYYRERRTAEDVQQPHSVVFQTLAELGLVGAALLAGLIAALAWGIRRAARRAGEDPRERLVVAAGNGIAVAWLVHASVDWILLLPGVTGVALVGIAAILRPGPAPPAAGRPWDLRQPSTFALGALAATVLVLAAVGFGRRLVVEHAVTDARQAVATDPAAALRLANRALGLDGDDMDAYYVKAGALARFGDPAPAIATLRAALRREPGNFVTWALLGDLETRAGRRAAARRAYVRAAALNPRDPALRLAVRRAS